VSARVLVVDDERNMRRMLRAVLEEEGYGVDEAATGEEALAACSRTDPDVMLLDLVMPRGPDGLSVLEQVRSQFPELIVVMMSGKATLDDAVRATKLGAFQFLEKPLLPESVAATVRAAVDLARARAEALALRRELPAAPPILGSSRAIEEVKALIAQAAPTDTRVLVHGESGTGKELVARALHAQSRRADRPLVSVNCAAVPRDLVESEMFGHERGAFTGAYQRRLGKFELAHGGTLLLDEVADLPEPAQAKLLRVLESGTIERIGGERTREVDVRVIAATNRDLGEAVAAGGFRRDLYYRLNVFPVRVPPLRERLGDVPALAQHFLREAAARSALPPRHLTDDATVLLRGHAWPGNVRELANMMERLTILGDQGPITQGEVATTLGQSAPTPDANPALGLRERLAAFEARLIREALAATGGNVAAAARHLGTDRANLYRRMRRLHVEWK
jgi:two-component system nitrogen regulation response regulator NtrX